MRAMVGWLVLAMTACSQLPTETSPPPAAPDAHVVSATRIGVLSVTGTTTIDIPPISPGDVAVVFVLRDTDTFPITHGVLAGTNEFDSWMFARACTATAEMWTSTPLGIRDAASTLTIQLDDVPQSFALDVVDVSGLSGLSDSNDALALPATAGEFAVSALASCSSDPPALLSDSSYTMLDTSEDTGVAYEVAADRDTGATWAAVDGVHRSPFAVVFR